MNVQVCESYSPWYEIKVNSKTNIKKAYRVLIPNCDSNLEEYICECTGFIFRGFCSHQEEAYAKMCLWNEIDGPEKQNSSQKNHKICPRCGFSTIINNYEFN